MGYAEGGVTGLRLGLGLGLGRLAHLKQSPIRTAEGDADASLHPDGGAQAGPASGDALLVQTVTDDRDELKGQHGDEQVTLDPTFLMVEHRA